VIGINVQAPFDELRTNDIRLSGKKNDPDKPFRFTALKLQCGKFPNPLDREVDVPVKFSFGRKPNGGEYVDTVSAECNVRVTCTSEPDYSPPAVICNKAQARITTHLDSKKLKQITRFAFVKGYGFWRASEVVVPFPFDKTRGSIYHFGRNIKLKPKLDIQALKLKCGRFATPSNKTVRLPVFFKFRDDISGNEVFRTCPVSLKCTF